MPRREAMGKNDNGERRRKAIEQVQQAWRIVRPRCPGLARTVPCRNPACLRIRRRRRPCACVARRDTARDAPPAGALRPATCLPLRRSGAGRGRLLRLRHRMRRLRAVAGNGLRRQVAGQRVRGSAPDRIHARRVHARIAASRAFRDRLSACARPARAHADG